MGDFLTQISNPAWWMGVVLMGLLLNVIGAYIKSLLDNFLSRFSVKWSKRTHKKEMEREALVKSLAEDEVEMKLFEEKYKITKFLSLSWFVGASLLLQIATDLRHDMVTISKFYFSLYTLFTTFWGVYTFPVFIGYGILKEALNLRKSMNLKNKNV